MSDTLDEIFDNHGQTIGYGDEYRTEVLADIKAQLLAWRDSECLKAYERGKKDGYGNGARDSSPPPKVNGMKYCRIGNRNVYSCGHYGC